MKLRRVDHGWWEKGGPTQTCSKPFISTCDFQHVVCHAFSDVSANEKRAAYEYHSKARSNSCLHHFSSSGMETQLHSGIRLGQMFLNFTVRVRHHWPSATTYKHARWSMLSWGRLIGFSSGCHCVAAAGALSVPSPCCDLGPAGAFLKWFVWAKKESKTFNTSGCCNKFTMGKKEGLLYYAVFNENRFFFASNSIEQQWWTGVSWGAILQLSSTSQTLASWELPFASFFVAHDDPAQVSIVNPALPRQPGQICVGTHGSLKECWSEWWFHYASLYLSNIPTLKLLFQNLRNHQIIFGSRSLTLISGT